MKANYATSAQRKRMVQVCKMQVEEQLDDAVKRAQYIWAMAMLKAGLSPKTVNKVKDLVPGIAERYADYRTDKIADFAFHSKLQEAGVDIDMTEREL